MKTESSLTSTAALFLALGDTTRLRLLNLMRDREVCVSSFTTVLGHSQPLVSRHLAYLRNAGVVEARRDGKWMHYSISNQLDDNTRRLVTELFKWMEGQPELNEEKTKYYASLGLSERAGKTPANRIRSVSPKEDPIEERQYRVDAYEPAGEVENDFVPASHNELEDFLL
ncbi:MAG TPA: metalloregulator ArsR/SmtB family transcription factor [Pyrinomonadaceae bacterium]